VNGHALSANVTVSASDVGLGSVANALQLVAANNLSDLVSAATARTNLGLATVAATGAYSDLTGTPSLNFLPLAGGTLTGELITAASTATRAGFTLPTGTAPTTPVAGDMWLSGGLLNFYDGSSTQNFVDLSSTQSSIGGAKTFTDSMTVKGTASSNVVTFKLSGGATALYIDSLGNLVTGAIKPSSGGTLNFGSTGAYYLNGYVTTLNLNSTASLSGGTAGVVDVETNNSATGLIINNNYSSNSGINQSSTAGYTALLVNPTETTTGSGTKLLADFQVGGVSKLSIDNTGKFGGAIQQVLATGASHTVDDVISALQTLGLVRQS
jgi:hypothetical protein